MTDRTGRDRQQQIEARLVPAQGWLRDYPHFYSDGKPLCGAQGYLESVRRGDAPYRACKKCCDALAARLSGLQDTLADAPFKSKAETLTEMIAFAETLDPDIGPLFGRDVARVLRGVAAALALNADGPEDAEADPKISHNPTQRAEATTTPEGAKGWVDQAGSAQVLAGGHGLDVAPDASPGGSEQRPASEQDGGGKPSSAPNAVLNADGEATER